MKVLAMCELFSTAPDRTRYPIPNEADLAASYRDVVRTADRYRADGRQVVAVQGLGFVGTAVAAAIAGATDSLGHALYFVIGVELPSANGYWKVAKLNDGVAPIVSSDVELSTIVHRAVNETGNLSATASELAYSLADVIVVDVTVDVRHTAVGEPDDIEVELQGFKRAIAAIGQQMRPEALVLIETTVPVGVCENVALPILLEERSRRGIRCELSLAYAYERVMPGPKYIDSIRRYWRAFAAINGESAVTAREFLNSFIETDSYPLYELENIASAEFAKLLENSYRAANIAFIHEWTLLAERIGINLFSVIDAIRMRRGTHDNIRLPGFGVGGYCLPKDSLLAQWSATNQPGNDLRLGMTLDALRINHEMPLHTFQLIAELARVGLAGMKIGICGVSYSPEVADTRNSPTEMLVDKLIDAGADVMVHDPYVVKWSERPKVPLTMDLRDCLEWADGIVFAVPHRNTSI